VGGGFVVEKEGFLRGEGEGERTVSFGGETGLYFYKNSAYNKFASHSSITHTPLHVQMCFKDTLMHILTSH